MSNTVAVVTDGTAVLGLGNIGPAASMPVMEGKAVLFKQFGGVDAIPVALDTTDADEIVETIVRLAPTFGGINLEDISSPRCFEIERRLIERLDIPVFHDDQHGTAVVVLAALLNAVRLTDRELDDLKVVISGAGAAGVAITRCCSGAGVRKIAIVDRQGVIHPGRERPQRGQAVAGRQDVRLGQARLGLRRAGRRRRLHRRLRRHHPRGGHRVDGAGLDRVRAGQPAPRRSTRTSPASHARVVATGRSDFPNQINNVLVFPGIFRGALDVRATGISEGMKLAAANAIADLVATTTSASRTSSRRRSTRASRRPSRAPSPTPPAAKAWRVGPTDHRTSARDRQELHVRCLRPEFNPDDPLAGLVVGSAPTRRCPTAGRR